MLKLLKWLDVGSDWRLGIDRFIKAFCVYIMANWFLDLLYVLPVSDSKALVQKLTSYLPI